MMEMTTKRANLNNQTMDSLISTLPTWLRDIVQQLIDNSGLNILMDKPWEPGENSQSHLPDNLSLLCCA
jgi:hypothetical protein